MRLETCIRKLKIHMSFRRPEKFVNRLETATRLDQNGLRGIERVNTGSTVVRFLNLQRDLKQTKEVIGRLHMQMQTSVIASGSDGALLEWIKEKIRGVGAENSDIVHAATLVDMFNKRRLELQMRSIDKGDIYCEATSSGIKVGFGKKYVACIFVSNGFLSWTPDRISLQPRIKDKIEGIIEDRPIVERSKLYALREIIFIVEMFLDRIHYLNLLPFNYESIYCSATEGGIIVGLDYGPSSQSMSVNDDSIRWIT